MNRVKNVAVLVSCIDEEYQNKILNGIKDYAQKEQFNIYIFNAFGNGSKSVQQDIGEYSIFKLVNYQKFDGVILLTNTITSEDVKKEILENLKGSNVCVVSIGDDLLDAYNINIDNFNAMSNMVDHLIEHHGLSRINYISGMDENDESYQRLKAYKNSLTRHNLPVEERRIYHGNFRYEDGINAVESFLFDDLPLPQAIVCANDVMALSTIKTLNSYGYHVPQDVCVTGFDRIYEAKNYSPEITTVERPLYDIGKIACKKIIKHINHEPQERCESVDTNIVFTASCGCNCVHQEETSEFRVRTYSLLSSYRQGIQDMNLMSSDLAGTASMDELLIRLQKYVLNLKCEEFYLCLCENWRSSYDAEIGFIDKITKGEYTKNVNCILSYHDGKFTLNGEKFPTMNLLPNYAEAYSLQNDGKAYWVSPIHFHEKCLGYCVIQGCDYPLTNPMFRTWISNVSTTIENLRNKTSLKNVIHELDKLYVIDNLSKIYNRNGFSRATEGIYQEACQNKDDIMVLFIDLDGLKYINDKFGHKEGDNAIIEVANAIKKCCTQGEVFARFGGDEFVVFSSNYDSTRVDTLCKNINEEFQRYNSRSGKGYKIGASMGYHITTADVNISIHNIINIADAKMYELKKRRNKARGQNV